MFRYTVTTIVIILYYFTLDSSLLLDFWYGEMFVFTSHQKDDCSSVCVVCLYSGTFKRINICLFVCFFFVFEWKEIAGEDIRRTFNTTYSVLFFLFFRRFFFLSLLWVFCLRFYLLLRSPVQKKRDVIVCVKNLTYTNVHTHTHTHHLIA